MIADVSLKNDVLFEKNYFEGLQMREEKCDSMDSFSVLAIQNCINVDQLYGLLKSATEAIADIRLLHSECTY